LGQRAYGYRRWAKPSLIFSPLAFRPLPAACRLDFFFELNINSRSMREIKSRIKKPTLVAKRREQILKTAMILFRKQGYHKTTMREICELSKVNRGSFYDYFESKEDILVYLYKQMMYQEGDFEKVFPRKEVSGWEDLSPFIRSIVHDSWNRDKHTIQLLYRETISLDKKTRREVMNIESSFIKVIAENLQKGLGSASISEELEIIANILVFMDSFLPLRGWNLHHLSQEKILEAVTGMVMGRLKELKGPEGEKRKKNLSSLRADKNGDGA
jgi:AcrR family transcriptional regulator